MSDKIDLNELADVFIKCADDNISLNDVLDYLQKIDGLCENDRMKLVVHSLHHYIIDEDIRKSDLSYDKAQKAKLRVYANEIKELIVQKQ